MQALVVGDVGGGFVGEAFLAVKVLEGERGLVYCTELYSLNWTLLYRKYVGPGGRKAQLTYMRQEGLDDTWRHHARNGDRIEDHIDDCCICPFAAGTMADVTYLPECRLEGFVHGY